MKTSGQMALHETILVLFVLVLLLIVGMVAYSRYSAYSFSRLALEMDEQQSTILLNSLLALPELGCADEACLDTGKFLPFQAVVNSDRGYYTQIFGAKKIEVSLLYPRPADGECTSQAYLEEGYPLNCDHWVLYDSPPQTIRQRIVVSSPISLYFPETDTHALGRVDINVYR